MGINVKGKGAVGVAIAYYSLRGVVSIPLEPGEYNLVFDNSFSMLRIKVISCSYKTKFGVFSASIRTSGGNQPNSKVKKFDPDSCEYLFIVTSELDMYEIPSNEIDAGISISLNVYQKYKVSFAD